VVIYHLFLPVGAIWYDWGVHFRLAMITCFPGMRNNSAMTKFLWVIASLLFVLVAGCQTAVPPTPTPFPTSGALTGASASSVGQPVPATITDILENPAFYEDAYVQVTGQYFRRPLFVCSIDPQPSPASWELREGEGVLPAGGFGNQLRQLLPDGMTLTVIGKWTQWEGPVGCGKQAVPQEIWYLDVAKIVEPGLLARVTLTPGGELIAPVEDEMVSPTAVPENIEPPPETTPPEEETAVSPTPTAAIIETLSAGFTPVATNKPPTPTPTPEPKTETATATAVPGSQATPTADGASSATPTTIATVTNTPSPGASLTPTQVPVATSTVENGDIIDVEEDVAAGEFYLNVLTGNEIHAYAVSLETDAAINISALGEPGADAKIEVWDSELNRIASRNDAPAGMVETLTFTAPADGRYKIYISDASGGGGSYLLTIGDEVDVLTIQAIINFGEVSGATIDFEERHFWFFEGRDGDRLTVDVTSQSGADLLMSLYDMNNAVVDDLQLAEQIQDQLLPGDGWYLLEFEEWDLDENSYQLTLVDQ
jgi:hypothetical protein